MSTPEDRIRELARARAIDEAEEARLLAAVKSGAPVRAAPRNPFARWSGEVTSAMGLGVALAGVATSRLGARYDGALDLHFGASVPLAIAILDQLVAWPLTALVFWVVLRALSRNVRAIDVLGVVGLSRAAYVVIAPPMALLVGRAPIDPTKGASLAMILLALVGLVGLGALVFLLVLGVRTVSGLRGGRLAAAFIGALLGAEIVTKLALWCLRPLFS